MLCHILSSTSAMGAPRRAGEAQLAADLENYSSVLGPSVTCGSVEISGGIKGQRCDGVPAVRPSSETVQDIKLSRGRQSEHGSAAESSGALSPEFASVGGSSIEVACCIAHQRG